MNKARHKLTNEAISATILANGAELCSLKSRDGRELLWQAGPQWPRHSPMLFPIVGKLKNDEMRHRGRTYPMNQHGVARDHLFAWIERETTSCTLVLTDNAETLARYPFPFRLQVSYTLHGDGLDLAFEVTNTGDEVLPASLGGHPAFLWPLLPDLPKEAYSLTFSHAEAEPIRRLSGGLIRPVREPNPVHDNKLALSERLFDDDAIIFDRLASSSVRYAADRGPTIDVSWQGFRELGIWSKPGGVPFLCIEPWRGFASPQDFDGEFSDKPGLMHIAPAESRVLSYRIRVIEDG